MSARSGARRPVVWAVKDPSDGTRPSVAVTAYAGVASRMHDAVGCPAVVIAAEARARAAFRSAGGTAQQMVGTTGFTATDTNPAVIAIRYRCPACATHPVVATCWRTGRAEVRSFHATVPVVIRRGSVGGPSIRVGATDAFRVRPDMVKRLVALMGRPDPLPRGAEPASFLTVAAMEDTVDRAEADAVVHRPRMAVPGQPKPVLGVRPDLTVETKRCRTDTFP